MESREGGNACRTATGMGEKRSNEWKTDPHFGPLDLPLVPVALIPTPFCLQKVEDTRQGEVLAILRWRRRDALALARLAVWALLLGRWALASLQVGWRWRHLERAKHGDLDCLWMVNVGRALLVVRWSSGIILGVVSTVELMKHVALLGCGEGILRVLLALLRVLLLLRLRRGLEVQEEAGRGEHCPWRRAETCQMWKQPRAQLSVRVELRVLVEADDNGDKEKKEPTQSSAPLTPDTATQRCT
jgi:hypothetical protein